MLGGVSIGGGGVLIPECEHVLLESLVDNLELDPLLLLGLSTRLELCRRLGALPTILLLGRRLGRLACRLLRRLCPCDRGDFGLRRALGGGGGGGLGLGRARLGRTRALLGIAQRRGRRRSAGLCPCALRGSVTARALLGLELEFALLRELECGGELLSGDRQLCTCRLVLRFGRRALRLGTLELSLELSGSRQRERLVVLLVLQSALGRAAKEDSFPPARRSGLASPLLVLSRSLRGERLARATRNHLGLGGSVEAFCGAIVRGSL